MLAVIARTPAVSLSTNLILPTPAARILLMPRNHENQVWDVTGVHLRRRAHPRVHNHVPDKFQNFTPSHAADPVSGQLASLARFKSFGRSPFFQTLVKRSRRSLYRWGVDVPGLGQYDGEQHPIRSAVPTFPLKFAPMKCDEGLSESTSGDGCR